jgi:GrpB-like predicted nucleotidyltransferase (UPF0157 family)
LTERSAGSDHPFAEDAKRDAVVTAAFVQPAKPYNATIHLAEYDPEWPLLYEREAARVREALGDRVMRLEHVGSTSVPGLDAKPRIDMMLAVPDTIDEAAYVPQLEARGYVLALREPDWYQHRLFRGPDIDINLHVFTAGCVELDRMAGFRDWLRSHPEDRDLYLARKRELSARTWRWMQDYADAKSDVVAEIIAKAGLPEARPESP